MMRFITLQGALILLLKRTYTEKNQYGSGASN
jgi:hypothetical protein